MRHSALVVLALLAPLGASGCGRTSHHTAEVHPSRTQAQPATTAGPTTTATKPPAVTQTTATPAFDYPLGRRRSRPSSVPEWADMPDDHFQEACPAQEDGARAHLSVRPDDIESSFQTVSNPVRLGDLLALCVDAKRTDLPVDATVRDAAGAVVADHRWPAGGGTGLDSWLFLAAGEIGEGGTYTLTVGQQDDTEELTFTVSSSDIRTGPWIDAVGYASTGDTIMLGSGGNRAHANVRFDVYAAEERDLLRYRTTVTVRADARGVALEEVHTREADAHVYVFQQRDQPGSATKLDLMGHVIGHPVSLPAGQRPRTLFQQHQVAPRDVARQFDYFQQGGPGSCPDAVTSDPEVMLQREQPRLHTDFLSSSETHFEVGDRLRICAYNFVEGQPARMTIKGPRGTRSLKYPALQVDQGIGYQMLIDADSPEGRYEVTIRQDGMVADMRFTVSDPTVPGYRTTTGRDGYPEVLVVGLPARQRFWLALYRPPTDAPLSDVATRRMQVGYVAGEAVDADARGIVAYRLKTDAADPPGCYVVKVSYEEHVLDDLNNTISLVCLPLQGSGTERRL